MSVTSALPTTTSTQDISPNALQYAKADELVGDTGQQIFRNGFGGQLHAISAPNTDFSDVADSQTAQRIDGNANNASQRTSHQTTDGKTVYVDPFESTRDVSIDRERTVTDDGRGNQYVTKDRLVFTTGDGNDNIQVARGNNGNLSIEVNGNDYSVEMAQGQALALRSGGGDDTINVASDVRVNLVVDGGDGNDSITTGAGNDIIRGGAGDDTVEAGAGSDDINGGAGNDTLLGNAGNDVVYGGNGNDTVAGGAGRDYLEGGTGDDAIYGMDGADMLSGGLGADSLYGGQGDDAVYTSAGQDQVQNTGGADRVFGQSAMDQITAAENASNQIIDVELDGTLGTQGIQVVGSDSFVARVESDLQMLRSSPSGQQMLEAFDSAAQNGNTLTIYELQNENNGFTRSMGGSLSWQGQPSEGSDAVIAYNPEFHSEAFPAAIGVLYHEMSHAYNAVTGTFQPGTYQGSDSVDRDAGVPNAERQAVGLDNTGVAYDFDHDPSTPATTSNPLPLSENGLRTELGLPLRLHYAL